MTVSWKQLLTEAESLSKSNGKNAWRVAQIVRDLWKSREFLGEACGGVLDDMTSKLAKYSGRFALGVNDMIQMIEHFPEQKDWESGRLDLLRDETCKRLAAKPRSEGGTKTGKPRKVISQAQYESLQRKNRELQNEIKLLRQENEKLLEAIKGKLKARA